MQRFVIDNEYCKTKGPFFKDSDNRSFQPVSKSSVKLTWLT